MYKQYDEYDYEFAVLEEDLKTDNKDIEKEEAKFQENTKDKKDTVTVRVEKLVEQAKNSLKEMIKLDQDQINHIVKEMA